MWRAYITTSEVYRRLLIFINPARDLGPRIAHALLSIPGKRDSDFAYGWIPVVGPIIGALLYAATFGSAPAPH
jgi:glycerol uptake facilitator-like aquaporin